MTSREAPLPPSFPPGSVPLPPLVDSFIPSWSVGRSASAQRSAAQIDGAASRLTAPSSATLHTITRCRRPASMSQCHGDGRRICLWGNRIHHFCVFFIFMGNINLMSAIPTAVINLKSNHFSNLVDSIFLYHALSYLFSVCVLH